MFVLLKFVGAEDGDLDGVDLGIDPFGEFDLCGPAACLFGWDVSKDKLASIEEPEGGLGDGTDAVGRGFCVVSKGDVELVGAACEDSAILEFGEGFVFVVFAVDGDKFVGEREGRGFGGGRFPRDADFFEGSVNLLFFGSFGFLEEG